MRSLSQATQSMFDLGDDDHCANGLGTVSCSFILVMLKIMIFANQKKRCFCFMTHHEWDGGYISAHPHW
jgi:hypothetical protein